MFGPFTERLGHLQTIRLASDPFPERMDTAFAYALAD